MKSLHQFDLNLLLTLEALISECHVSRAAQRMHLSQSAMSHALNRLRQQLEDPILVRSGKGLQPTPRAQEMLSQIRHIISLLEQTLTPNPPFSPSLSSQTFTIACTDFFEMEYFPKLLQRIQAIAPQVVIDLEVISEQTFTHDLESKKIDLVVGIDEAQTLPTHLIKQSWCQQPFACLTGMNNDLPGTPLSLEQYCLLPHISFLDVTGSATSPIDRWLASHNLSRRHIARVVNYVAAARAITVTNAIMTLPLDMARSFSKMFELKLFRPPAMMPNIEMNLVHHPLFSNDPALIWLINQIKALEH